MADDVLVILDKCLERIRRGETVEQCLADYPELRSELEPLLKMYKKVSSVQRVTPSAEFKQQAFVRLISRIENETKKNDNRFKNRFSLDGLRRSLVFKTLAPVTIVALLALIVWIALPVFSPTRFSANEITLSVLSGSAEIQRKEAIYWASGTDGMNLEVGSRVRTPPESHVLLTFFDSSTIKLEPGAEVLITESEYVDKKSVLISLVQELGKTWTYVAPGNNQTNFTVHTPHCDAVAQGTAFITEVDRNGKTRFAVAEGGIKVIEGSREVKVEADKQIEVEERMALSEPLPVQPSENELVISTLLPGVGSVCDPNGASTGHFPDGVAFNQITNSRSVFSTAGQEIKVGDPVSGEYLLAVRGSSDDDIPVDIQAKRNGKVVFQYKETLRVKTGEGWIIRIKMDFTDQTDVKTGVLSVEPLAGKAPENVKEPVMAKKWMTPALPASSQVKLPASQPVTTSTPEDKITAAGPATVKPSGTPDYTGQNPVSPPVEPRETPPETTPQDSVTPEVIATSPGKDAEEVDVAGLITATFSEEMNADTINMSAFSLFDGSMPVTGFVRYDVTARTAVFDPEYDLQTDTVYTASVSKLVKDLAGNRMNDGYSWSFKTMHSEEDDITPPEVVSVSPEDNSVDAAVNLAVKVVFSEEMNEEYILDNNNFSLEAGGTGVSCTASYERNTRTAVFTPDASLQYNTTYTATVAAVIADIAGNHLAEGYSWSFSTGTPSQMVALSVIAPEKISTGSVFDVKIHVSEVNDLSAFEFDLSYDETVIQVADSDEAVTQGIIGMDPFIFESLTWSLIPDEEYKIRVLGFVSREGVSGSGYIVSVRFNVIGSAGQSSSLILYKAKKNTRTKDYLFDSKSRTIAADVISGLVTVSP